MSTCKFNPKSLKFGDYVIATQDFGRVAAGEARAFHRWAEPGETARDGCMVLLGGVDASQYIHPDHFSLGTLRPATDRERYALDTFNSIVDRMGGRIISARDGEPTFTVKREGGVVKVIYDEVKAAAPSPESCGDCNCLAQCGDTAAHAADWAASAATDDSEERHRMQLAGISSAALGYWRLGESIHPDYLTQSLKDVAGLYDKYEKARKRVEELEGYEREADRVIDTLRAILGAKEGEDVVAVARNRMAVLRAAGIEGYHVESARWLRKNHDDFCNTLQAAGRALDMPAGSSITAELVPAIEGLKSRQVPRGERFDPLATDNAMCDRLYSFFQEGRLSRENGNRCPYPGRSVASQLHSFGWVQRDLRLALDAASQRGKVEAMAEHVSPGYKPPHGGRPTPGNEPCELAGAGAALGLHEPDPEPGYSMGGPLGADDFQF